MRVFVTGATGWVGAGVVRELLAAGHTVTALTRRPEAATDLAASGVTLCRGDLGDLATLRAAAMASDAVIHCAFEHQFGAADLLGIILVRLTRWVALARVSPVARMDFRAVDAMIDGLAASRASGEKVLLCTSPIAVLPSGRVGRESEAGVASSFGCFRVATERLALAASRRGVRSAVIRLPPSVHGAGDTGFVPTLIDIARSTGVSGYPGRGDNRWSAVHRDDAAALYRMAMEQLAAGTLAGGSILHAVADEGVPLRMLAAAIADRLELGAPVARTSKHFGSFGMFASMDNPASADQTRALTGWAPRRPALLDDVRSAAYALTPAKRWRQLREA